MSELRIAYRVALWTFTCIAWTSLEIEDWRILVSMVHQAVQVECYVHHGGCLTSLVLASTGFSNLSTLLANRRRLPLLGFEWSFGTSKNSSETFNRPGIWWVLFPRSFAAVMLPWTALPVSGLKSDALSTLVMIMLCNDGQTVVTNPTSFLVAECRRLKLLVIVPHAQPRL